MGEGRDGEASVSESLCCIFVPSGFISKEARKARLKMR
jgi:hypothetical protein